MQESILLARTSFSFAGHFSPPTGLYHQKRVQCTPSTNKWEADISVEPQK